MILNPHNMLLKLFFIFPLIVSFSGCSTIQVVDIDPQALTSTNLNNKINEVVGIELFDADNGGYSDADRWQQGFSEALHNEAIFEAVYQPVVDKRGIDFIIRGNISGSFRPNGAKNFFTWWPGPLIFAQGWRGNRYIYDLRTDVEIIEASSGDIIGKYNAENSHELIHKSYNPWHLFGTLIFVPGIIKGSFAVSPSAQYRQQIYELAYPKLWKNISNRIAEDQLKKYTQRIDSLQNKCGVHFNEELEIGMVWSEYISCQSRKFSFLGQEEQGTGVLSVYMSNDRSLRVHVTDDDRIIRWYIKK